MSNLSFVEQVRMFYNHDIILSPHGSALINVVFCIPHSVLLECNPPYFYELWYINTASLSNVHYISVSTFHPQNNTYEAWNNAEECYNNGTFERIHRKYLNYDIDPPLIQLKYSFVDACNYIKRWHFVYSPYISWSEIF